ncbi:Salicylate hydroxylase [Cytospora mali]|uniref:Salicylate hydroxylase n=1 Tax=Cytospora mali TaxID=578113 RepID=A0A194VND5_CYTMA|nr:Salicylate hydroxylase [Valsa mali]
MTTANINIAIIGAGLSGLTLALALHQQGISCTVYESRPAPLDIGGAVMLSPNALRVLDALHIYNNVKTKGYNFDQLQFRDLPGNLLETYEFGSVEKYGYKALRIYRHVLIDALVADVQAKAIPIRYGMKFSHIAEDNLEGVTFAFTDGTTVTTSLLIGADGIHSKVRKHLYPELEPKFIGMAGITAAVPTAQLKLPEGYHIPVTITSPNGAFVIAPQEPDGSEVLIGKQRRVPEQDRAAWEKTLADKEDAVRFLQQDRELFPEVVQNATSQISTARVNVWPFFVVPKLDRWASETRRVIIVGDAAHAIPPSAGQGINQAFEDIYMLALVLGRAHEVSDMQAALGTWQSYLQGRVDKVLELNKQIDLRRMPVDDAIVGEGSGFEKADFDLDWLYKPDFRGVVDGWVAKQKQ